MSWSTESLYMARLSFIYREKNKSKVVKVNFRDKSRIGWSGHIESYTFDNGKKLRLKNIQTYFINI